jgi:alpha-glucan, water dikinase
MFETVPKEILTAPAAGLSVTSRHQGNRLTLVVRLKSNSDCLLHWGLGSGPERAWQLPPTACWPEGTAAAGGQAVRTPFRANDQGEREVAIQLDLPSPWKNLPFVLFFPKENRWLKSGGKDFSIPLPRGTGDTPTPEEALVAWAPHADTARQVFTLDSGDRLAVAIQAAPETVRVHLACDADPPLALHWGIVWQFAHEWKLPPESFRPAGSSVFDQQAVRSPFVERDGLRYLEVEFHKPADGPGPRGMKFIVYQPQGAGWTKCGGKDLYLPLFAAAGDSRLGSLRVAELAEQIIGVEKGANSWTLMHRFNLCHDLVERAQDDEESMALLFAWLRYSATRQLDWQRRYNTQPRELSHSQDRLTMRLASIWRRHPTPTEPGAATGCRMWVRLLLTTLGRGGEGQRVRDEILHIMHRNHLKEVSGHFMEEWHQKLHNNTTPDDIVICTAYLAFLNSHGDQGAFYRKLEEGGVSRARLQSFERPIKSEPTFYGDRKDALVRDFENFLRILKSVHAGTDLDSASAAARGRLGEGLRHRLDGVLWLRHQQPAESDLAAAITTVREGLRDALAAGGDDAALRDLLFLDLALEELLRGTIERQNLSRLDRDRLAELVHWTLRNLNCSVDSKELAVCAGHWQGLLAQPRDSRDWALHAKSVADRAARWVLRFTSDLYERLQPKAEFLGAAFEAETWTVPLFSEEVIRGGPAFALSSLLRHLDPILRKAAGLGGWQVISPAQAAGQVHVVDRLIDVQGDRFQRAMVLVADTVSGSEEIPDSVTAVITSDMPDLVSHVAVRARNARVLFATCFEPEAYRHLKELKDKTVSLRVTPGGDVEYLEAETGDQEPTVSKGTLGGSSAKTADTSQRKPASRSIPAWLVTQDQFTPEIVGGKSNNLNGLRGRLADWIQLPTSLALPFGAFEAALEDEGNRELRGKYEALIATAEQNPAEVLSRVRALLLETVPPAGLKASLLEAWSRASLPSVPWEQTWHAIQRVWASKWNERAYLSRQARGIPHDSLRMAVLIQQVVEADYAFVIHTVNPLTGNRDELYAEVVLGLGETLVGNYPGRALGFVCRKADLQTQLISYPGKSVGLYGKGVIFRSDSNGEDLEGFAGAGLYDSFLAEEPERRLLDDRGEKLIWDQAFRDDLLRGIARVGLEVERVLGSPQDVEGAVAHGKFYVVQTRPQVGLSDG